MNRAAGFVAASLVAVLCTAGCRPRDEPPPAPADAGSAPASESGGSPAKSVGAVPAAPSMAPPRVDEPTPAANAAIAFESVLQFGDDAFRISVRGDTNRKLLIVTPMHDGQQKGDPAVAALDGDVVDAYVVDLDEDQNPEILVFARGRGTGQPGAFAGFSYTAGRFSALTLPELDASQAGGYRGSDTFNLEKNRIVRRFPVFSGEGDQPTGSVRTITYALQGSGFGVEKTEG